MEIIINQQAQHVSDNCSVEQLVAQLMPSGHQGIAVAVNQSIIPKAQWPHRVLKPGEKVIFIEATQGG